MCEVQEVNTKTSPKTINKDIGSARLRRHGA